jgi:RNA polymerase sigma-70 factor (ECF subfamily)
MEDHDGPGAAAAADSLDHLAGRVQDAMARGDRASACDAFETIVGRLQRRAVRVAFWYMRDAADAEDAVQDAFLKAFERIESYHVGQPFETWFLRVLVNGCLDRLKARTRRGRWLLPSGAMEPEHFQAPASLPDPEATLLSSEQRRELAEAISQLPARQRTVLVLSKLEGLSGPEIGALTGLSESTVRVHLFRALRRIRGVLEEAAGTWGHASEGRARR